MFNTFFPKIVLLQDNAEKCYTVGLATDDSIFWHTCFAWWITKSTNTYSECVILITFP